MHIKHKRPCLTMFPDSSKFNKNHRWISEGGEGGARYPWPPFFYLYFQNVLRFCFENRFIKCSFILSSKTLMLRYFASQIRPHCCMVHVQRTEVFIWEGGGEGEGGTWPSLSEFSGSAPENTLLCVYFQLSSQCLGMWSKIDFSVFDILLTVVS